MAAVYIFFSWESGRSGRPTTHTGDVLGCGKPDILLKARKYRGRRLGGLNPGGQPFTHFGIEVSQADDFLIRLDEGNFTNALKPIPTTPEWRASRRRPFSMEEVRTCQRKKGDLRRVAPGSGPDVALFWFNRLHV